jgi:two-component system response regulator LytT
MKTYQHIIFWILAHASLTLIFGKWFENYVEAFYYVSLLLPVVMATAYFFNYFLVPRYLFKRRFLLFGIYTFYMFVISLTLELLASVTSMLMMIKFNINEYGPLVTDVFLLGIILHFVVLFMSFILLIKHYFIDQGAIGQLEEEKSKFEKGFITIRSNRKSMRIEFNNLLYIESMADYIKIHTADGGEVVSKEKISHMEKELPDTFIRIHRSFIVNKEKITSFNREEILLGETELPVSRSYRSAAILELGRQ